MKEWVFNSLALASHPPLTWGRKTVEDSNPPRPGLPYSTSLNLASNGYPLRKTPNLVGICAVSSSVQSNSQSFTVAPTSKFRWSNTRKQMSFLVCLPHIVLTFWLFFFLFLISRGETFWLYDNSWMPLPLAMVCLSGFKMCVWSNILKTS